jgi:hypothetical protein
MRSEAESMSVQRRAKKEFRGSVTRPHSRHTVASSGARKIIRHGLKRIDEDFGREQLPDV